MGGLYLCDSLKKDGLHTAKVQDIVKVRLSEVHFAESGPLVHPRQHDPVNRDLVESLKAGFDPSQPLTVRDAGMVSGVRRLEVIDGAQRVINGRVAEAELSAEGKLSRTDGHYMVAVRLFDGSDLACLMERERRQSDALKRPHAPSVLYASYTMMEKLGATREEIATVAPIGCDVAAILRWPALCEDVQKRLDDGEAPLVVIGPLLDVPREQQAAALSQMIKTGALTPRKAKNVAKKVTGVPDKPKPPKPMPVRTIDAVSEFLAEKVPERQDIRLVRAFLRLAATGSLDMVRAVDPGLAEMLDALRSGSKAPAEAKQGAHKIEVVEAAPEDDVMLATEGAVAEANGSAGAVH